MKVFLRLCVVAGLIRVSSGVDDCTDDTILLQVQSTLKDVKGLAHVKDNDMLEQTQSTQSTPSIEQEPEDDEQTQWTHEDLFDDSWDAKAVAHDLAHNGRELERLLASSVETTMDEVWQTLTGDFDVDSTAIAFNKLLDAMNNAAEFATKVADEASQLKDIMDSSDNVELLQSGRRRGMRRRQPPPGGWRRRYPAGLMRRRAR